MTEFFLYRGKIVGRKCRNSRFDFCSGNGSNTKIFESVKLPTLWYWLVTRKKTMWAYRLKFPKQGGMAEIVEYQQPILVLAKPLCGLFDKHGLVWQPRSITRSRRRATNKLRYDTKGLCKDYFILGRNPEDIREVAVCVAPVNKTPKRPGSFPCLSSHVGCKTAVSLLPVRGRTKAGQPPGLFHGTFRSSVEGLKRLWLVENQV